MVSGSMALPDSVFHKWKAISGHTLLERYGMTEIGMALSNPYNGARRPGYVGHPLPGVECKVSESGELLIKGPSVFSEYWNRPEATNESFDSEGFFKTGDIVEIATNGDYKICGRSSVDIIKSAGYKISALDIERELLEHPSIAECAVVGVPDSVFGQVIGAIVTCKVGETLTFKQLEDFCHTRLAKYKTVRKMVVVDSIPKCNGKGE